MKEVAGQEREHCCCAEQAAQSDWGCVHSSQLQTLQSLESLLVTSSSHPVCEMNDLPLCFHTKYQLNNRYALV